MRLIINYKARPVLNNYPPSKPVVPTFTYFQQVDQVTDKEPARQAIIQVPLQ